MKPVRRAGADGDGACTAMPKSITVTPHTKPSGHKSIIRLSGLRKTLRIQAAAPVSATGIHRSQGLHCIMRARSWQHLLETRS